MSIDLTKSVTDTTVKQQRNKELKKACQEFESVLTYEMLKSMRNTVDKCDLLSGGQGEEIYESMLDQELAKRMSSSGSNSLSELLYQQLSRLDSTTQAGQAADAETSADAGTSTASRTSAVSGVDHILKSRAVSSTDKVVEVKSNSETVASSDDKVQTESDTASAADDQPDWPLKSAISSKFGVRKDPFTAENKFHSGIDIAAATGTEVKAAMSGKVIMSGNMEGYGNVVAVDHGQGVVTIYGHNETNLVKVGDTVEKGSTIAKVGSTGRSTGPHLHFEVRKDGTKIDPVKFLGVA
jgi:peptidoglycan hydrolase FlgJ